MSLEPLERELVLLRYIDALESGDLDGIAACLQLAEQDKELEAMILELHTDPNIAGFLPPASGTIGTNHHPVRKIITMPLAPRTSNLTFWVAVAALIVAMVVMIPYLSQPDTSLTVLPLPDEQQDEDVDCLADRAYRVVYAEELPDLTTEDLKCVFIVGDLRGLDISHLDFSDAVMRDVNMSGMELTGMGFNRAMLMNADLSGANLRQATFISASLPNANLTMANLDWAGMHEANLNGANLSGASLNWTTLFGANLRNADLSCAGEALASGEAAATCANPTNLSNANLQNATLYKANLQSANLDSADVQLADFTRANLQGANLDRAILFHATFETTNLQNARLTNANIREPVSPVQIYLGDLSGLDMSNSNLNRSQIGAAIHRPEMGIVNLSQSHLDGSFIWDLNIPRANLQGASFVGASFWQMTLTEANLAEANLSRAVLEEVKLTNADLTNTNLYRADLIDVDLTGADLTGVDLTNAAFTNVIWTDVTLPDGTTWTEETDLTRFTDADHADYWRSDDPDSPAYGGE